MLARCRAALTASFTSDAPLYAIAGVYCQNVRWMGRGPTIQGKKNATDAKRTTTNAKLAREIMVISKCMYQSQCGFEVLWMLNTDDAVGGDANNVRLVAAINKAKAANMPKDKIEAAIKRGVEGKDGSNAEAVLYEATGPAGSALMIETLTDNKRRTAPALRHILGKNSGALGTNGSVAWMFERKGYLEIELSSGDGDKPEMDEDTLMEITLEAGADDVEMREGLAQVTCDPSELAAVRKSFTEAGLEPAISELIYNPKEFLDLEGEQRETFDKLIDALNEDEDVNQIHHNVNE
ncbi:transcriptional regulatory protein [Phytophthora nicotianae]|uniref:Transcriptional regulatory protein n=1 Tax=Phytophthora nicotianae TaxID=4792 RepID=A0A0W8C360_PHYNI|nr:transcriptional regulatory protein [Phytophthora nicotianae]